MMTRRLTSGLAAAFAIAAFLSAAATAAAVVAFLLTRMHRGTGSPANLPRPPGEVRVPPRRETRRLPMRVRHPAAIAVAVALAVALMAAAAPADTGPAFVIGDVNAVTGSTVEFWGAQWWQLNTVSGGPAPASFKGFAVTISPTGPCTGTFTSDPGNSSAPPATVNAVIPVLVTDNVTQSGSVISGDYSDVVKVATNAGYGPDPGHAGTGTVIGSLCGPPPPPPQ